MSACCDRRCPGVVESVATAFLWYKRVRCPPCRNTSSTDAGSEARERCRSQARRSVSSQEGRSESNVFPGGEAGHVPAINVSSIRSTVPGRVSGLLLHPRSFTGHVRVQCRAEIDQMAAAGFVLAEHEIFSALSRSEISFSTRKQLRFVARAVFQVSAPTYYVRVIKKSGAQRDHVFTVRQPPPGRWRDRTRPFEPGAQCGQIRAIGRWRSGTGRAVSRPPALHKSEFALSPCFRSLHRSWSLDVIARHSAYRSGGHGLRRPDAAGHRAGG